MRTIQLSDQARSTGNPADMGMFGTDDTSTTGPRAQSQRWEPQFGGIVGHIGRWLFLASAMTAPISIVDFGQQLRRSGSSSITWELRRRRGKRITLSEARQLALSILAETERRLRDERSREARFVLELWYDEDAPGR